MSESICVFMPRMESGYDIRPVHFVLETEFHKMRQPFFFAIHYLHLVTSGTATLVIGERRYELSVGNVFFAFPACLYELVGSDDFEYMYISFMGADASALLENMEITVSSPVHNPTFDLIPFWSDSIKHMTDDNSAVLALGVLYYTLSFVGNSKSLTEKKNNDLIYRIVTYIDAHYRESGFSLEDISYKFSYTGKYLSALIKKHLNISFRQYLNKIRIQYAIELMEKGEDAVSKISEECGYSEPEYFSKVFRNFCGMSPTEYLKRLRLI